MSADTTVVIAGHQFDDYQGVSFTAAVVQAAENFTTGSKEDAFQSAKRTFLDRSDRLWFHDWGAYPRAQKLGELLAEETRENSILEYDDVLVIMIEPDEVCRMVMDD